MMTYWRGIDACDKMVEVKKSEEAEIAHLTAFLRGNESDFHEEKGRENQELIKICDDPLTNVGK